MMSYELARIAGNYSEPSFWKKLLKNALEAGRFVVEKALMLYYCMTDPDTPAWAKTVVIGALAYFILPFDLIPDVFVPVGYSDDLAVLASACSTIKAHLKDEHVARAREKADKLFD